jgi:hypothetical protein
MEKIEFIKDPILEAEQLLANKNELKLEDLKELKERGFSTEKFLTYLNKKHGYLFHGSRAEISFGEKIKSSKGKLFATNEGSVAIIKALFANNVSGLKNLSYSLNNDSEQKVIIEGNVEIGDVISEKGYVYIFNGGGFGNEDTQGKAEFSKKDSDEGENIIKIIEIEKADFKYQIEQLS